MRRFLFTFLTLLCTTLAWSDDDVDTRIPQSDETDEKTFVLVISNENYKHEEQVPFANHDGEMFAAYCEHALGVPAKNIHHVSDATLNDMTHELQWLSGVMQAFNGEARAIVYYSGHGMPDEQSKSAILLPTDGYASDAKSGLSINAFYATLSAMPTRQTLLFMDACFSGSKRDGSMLASSRGVAIKAKTETVKGNMVVFSAAQGDETAYPYKDKKHGLFTYYLLSKLQETGGSATLGDLGDYVKTQVSRSSLVENGKSQTPTVTASNDAWRQWRLANKPAKGTTYYKSKATKSNKTPRTNPAGPVNTPVMKQNLNTTPVDMPSYKIEGAGTGVQGTYLLRVTVTAKKANDVTDDALMRGALHGVLFRGFNSQQNRQNQRPMAGNAMAEQQYKDFYTDFFHDDFRNYAYTSSESRTVMKVGKTYEVSALVTVSKDQLRSYLESQGVLKKLTFGF